MQKKTQLQIFYVILLILASLMLVKPVRVVAQQDTDQQQESSEPEETTVKAIEITDISAETEKLGQRILKLREILIPQTKALEVDSLLNSTYRNVQNERDSIFKLIQNLDERDLQGVLVEWNGHKSELKDFQGVIESRIKALNDVSEEVADEMRRWQITKEKLTENTESTELFANIDTMTLRLQSIVEISLIRLDSVFTIQKRLTDVLLIADEIIAEINRARLELQKDYFVLDSPPIWNFEKIRELAFAGLSDDVTGDLLQSKSRIEDDMDRLWNFLIRNLKSVIFQILFILLIYILLLVVKNKWKHGDAELTDDLEQEARIVIQNPVASAITVGMLISSSFYDVLIPVYKDFIILVILISTVYLMPKLSHRKIFIPLLILLAAYIFSSTLIYFTKNPVLYRILLLAASVAITLALAKGKKVMQLNVVNFQKIGFFRKFVLPTYLAVAIVAVFANVIGMVRLAQFLSSAILLSTGLGAVVYLNVKVFTSIVILAFKFRNEYQISSLSHLVEIIRKRIRPVLIFAAIILWIFFTLSGFGLYEYLRSWIVDLLSINWKVGEMTISVGGILSFTVIFLITMFIARIIANLFQDQWLITVLPRGIAPAISLIIRIILIITGFYMGLSAAGFDLSKVSLLIGALGVGIGFGLQSVVLNFISGLILAFERPINLGDAIEVDNEMGVVTSIGVRASNIKTYKGSEVIIPNGDLVSKKVINWTLSNRDRRSRILMKTSADADPKKVIELFNRIAKEHTSVYENPAPMTHFYGYNQEGNLDFALIYWTSFSDTLNTDSEIALEIFKTLKEEGIQAPIPRWKIESDQNNK